MYLYLDRAVDELWWGGEPDGTETAEVIGEWALSEVDADLVLEVWARTCPARRAGTRCYAHNPGADELVAYDAGPRLTAVRALAGALQERWGATRSGVRSGVTRGAGLAEGASGLPDDAREYSSSGRAAAF